LPAQLVEAEGEILAQEEAVVLGTVVAVAWQAMAVASQRAVALCTHDLTRCVMQVLVVQAEISVALVLVVMAALHAVLETTEATEVEPECILLLTLVPLFLPEAAAVAVGQVGGPQAVAEEREAGQ